VAGLSSAWLIHIVPLFASMPGALGAFERMVSDSFLFFALYSVVIAALHQGIGPFRQTARLLADLLPQRPVTQAIALDYAAPETNRTT
jgi:hypothetical protein